MADCAMPVARTLVNAPTQAPSSDASALWLDALHLRWPTPATATAASTQAPARVRLLRSATAQLVVDIGQPARGADSALTLQVHTQPLAADIEARARWAGPGPVYAAPRAHMPWLAAAHREQLLLVAEDADGRVLRATAVQHAAALDALYADAADKLPAFGASVTSQATRFALWAPTAQAVHVCLHANGRPDTPARALLPLQRQAASGAWTARVPQALDGQTYSYLVDVVVRGTGLVRNRVTDPWALSLNANSQRSWIGRLDDAALKPPGWDSTPRPQRVKTATDMAIYELHVRDFSVGDASVRQRWRGGYMAFTESDSAGMRHLRTLSAAGITDLHLLPVFDLASVPETGCTSPDAAALAAASPAADTQQTLVMSGAATDCFNWGYDPWHFTAPEGSFATDPHDGAVRVREFRAMVQALHRAGLRVGMDVVYNHTSASGQHAQSVLDRIVPGYYHRLDAKGVVERSTCCDNTATEHRLMARLMIDSAVVWARDHHIDSFRFDLMGHQPRAAMERLQAAVNKAAGRHIHLIGEGWNFGEVQDGKRFVQASQLSLNGSGIGTFSDRARDAVRGGSAGDSGAALVDRQGWGNGLHHDANPAARLANGSAMTSAEQDTRSALLRTADMVRVGLAGTLRRYMLHTHKGERLPLEQISYAGQPAGYASQPGEVVNYVENHDNLTLFDNNVFKLPPGTRSDDRARVQVLALATTAFSQGTAYFHAGSELLRSKSLDRNSFDSGDWFNRIDWTANENFFGTGLPPKGDNGQSWPQMAPLLADTSVKPTPEDIRFTRDAFMDLLKIRSSSTLFRLPTADAVSARLHFHNTGPGQEPTVVVARLDGRNWPGAGFTEVLYAINVDARAHTLRMPELKDRAYVLHPVHQAAGAADQRPVRLASWTPASGQLQVPPRTAVVYVLH